MKKVFLILAGLQLTGSLAVANLNWSHQQDGQSFHQIYVLGDSLSDNGALVGARSEVTEPILGHGFEMDDPFYQNHSFSNGRVAAEVLANKLGLELDAAWDFDFLFQHHSQVGNNYAIGGAQATPMKWYNPKGWFFNKFTIEKQVDMLLKQHTLQDDDLAFFQVGNNDFWFQILEASSSTEQEAIIQNSVSNQGKALQRLIDNGSKHILVMNTPDLGKIPEYRGTDQEEFMSKLTGHYNDIWMKMIANLQQEYPHYLKLYDIFGQFENLLDDFAAQGGNITKGAVHYDLNLGAILSGHITPKYNEGVTFETINDHFFFDFVHPTEKVHGIVGETLYQLVQSDW